MIIDGKKLSEEIMDNHAKRLAALAERGISAKLAIVFVGNDKSSRVYVNMILKRCAKIDLPTELIEFAEDCAIEDLIAKIEALNGDDNYSGIIVQLPLPKQLDEERVREAISPLKDVDSAGTRNIGLFYAGSDCHKPCTPLSMLALLKTVDDNLTGKRAVVIGRSNVVGKPIANMLLAENMTVSICHSKTADLAAYTKQADVVMAATGFKHLVTKDMLKADSIVIDAGIIVEDGQVYGDVNPDGVENVVKALTPVPGGVGPVTIAMLIGNVIDAAERLNAQ